jgi:hypothetical protein
MALCGLHDHINRDKHSLVGQAKPGLPHFADVRDQSFDLEAPMNVFSRFLSVRETAWEAERKVSGVLMLANREAFGLVLKSCV